MGKECVFAAGKGFNSQVRKLRPERLKHENGFARRVGWATGLGSAKLTSR